ncbi:HK97-gp10 family putative phage morphogenesis protein [Thermaerobacillus caldiproteolyticus]|uniref:HK97-gp10 family putative phage morphogenesis protein n=1 Tax=Thermaerobacillus caldiproteolyticus TaxID=247480 RepID=UPI00188A1FC8|nr:HK97-gp10 family putative phage morphogenesis protein [Anoxybacillus caldiproteolyticus]QPA31625.1 HK97 gp10 family phage protein [Anoxybacillus caldiproteolyticus]
MGLELHGMQELLRQLEQVGSEAERVKKDALLAGAEVVQQAASEKAPRDTGKLAENIVISDIKEDGTVDIGPDRDRFYGLFLEFGTSKMAARPFLQPAFEENKEQVQQKMADVIRREMGL